MKRIIKNGTIVTGSGSFPGDILIEGEKIRAVGNHEEIETLADKDTAVTDAAGCLVFPGFIDAHTHFDLHVAGTVTADDFATGTDVYKRQVLYLESESLLRQTRIKPMRFSDGSWRRPLALQQAPIPS